VISVLSTNNDTRHMAKSNYERGGPRAINATSPQQRLMSGAG
jgi:hypothetical protein